MKTISIVVVCALGVAYGDTQIGFKLDQNGVCNLENPNDVRVVSEGDTIRVDAYTARHINKATCSVRNQEVIPIPTPPEFKENKDGFYLHVKNVSRDLSGTWNCTVAWNSFNGNQLHSSCFVVVKITDYTQIFFNATDSDKNKCDTAVEGPVRDKRKFKIEVQAFYELYNGTCYLRSNGAQTGTNQNDIMFEKLHSVIFKPLTIASDYLQFKSKEMHGKTLVCTVDPSPNSNFRCQRDQCVMCELPLKFEEPQPSENATSTSHAEENKKLKDNNDVIIIIGCVVGVIVLVIIVGQSVALLYFRKRAQAQERMKNLENARQPFDRGNEARYSAPPSRRGSRHNRDNADTDSHIYEMVGINAMYNAGSLTGKITDIKDRPPLPLPGEAYEAPDSIDSLARRKPKLTTSALSLEASDAGDPAPPPRPAKKDPPLPARAVLSKPALHIDEPPSLPGSLQRPPKPAAKTGSVTKNMVPKPALQKDEPPSLPGSLQRPPKPATKTGSIPKNMANDPAIKELKKVLEKRKVESTLPQTSTPTEKKAPPIPAKKNPEKPNKKPVGVIQPLSPPETATIPPTSPNSGTSTLKAKLEAAFKPKRELTTTMPGRVPQTKAELPTSTVPARLPQTTKPVLPLPNNAALVLPNRPLPPIQAEESNQEDDGDWTYEPLDQFNIYNV